MLPDVASQLRSDSEPFDTVGGSAAIGNVPVDPHCVVTSLAEARGVTAVPTRSKGCANGGNDSVTSIYAVEMMDAARSNSRHGVDVSICWSSGTASAQNRTTIDMGVDFS